MGVVKGGVVSLFVLGSICINVVILTNFVSGVSSYDRPPARDNLSLKLPRHQQDYDPISPQQVCYLGAFFFNYS